MSYPDEDRWAFDDDERCVPSKDGYFLNERECEEYKALKVGRWHYGTTPNQRTRWCAPHEEGEHDSFAECEKSRLSYNLRMDLEQSGGGGKTLVTKRLNAKRDIRTDSVTLVEAAKQVLENANPVELAKKTTQVIDDLVPEPESSAYEMDELRAQRDDSLAREEKAKKDLADLLQTLRPTLENALSEYQNSTTAFERSLLRVERELRRQTSLRNVTEARERSDFSRETLRFKTAVKDEAKKQCGEVMEALKECQEEAKKRKERSLDALRAIQLSVLTTILYLLTYVKTVGDVRMRSVLSRLLPVGYDVYFLEDNAPPPQYHGTRTD